MKILLSFVGFVNLHIAAAANGLAGDVLNEGKLAEPKTLRSCVRN